MVASVISPQADDDDDADDEDAPAPAAKKGKARVKSEVKDENGPDESMLDLDAWKNKAAANLVCCCGYVGALLVKLFLTGSLFHLRIAAGKRNDTHPERGAARDRPAHHGQQK